MKTKSLILSLMLLLVMVTGLLAVDVTIGAGDQQNRKPFDFYHRFSVFEAMYYPQEINQAGYISSISYYNNFPNGSYTHLHVQIFMGTTTLPDLSTGWVPSTQLVQVFNGHLDFPSGQNVVTFNLNTPFLYTGGNLVIMTWSPGMNMVPIPSVNFLCQTVGTARARDFYSSNIAPDPTNPPMTGNYLNLSGQFAKTTLHFNDVPVTTDLGITAFTGPASMTLGTAYTHNVSVTNAGTASVTAFTVKLYDWNNVELASAAYSGAVLVHGASTDIPVIWTPSLYEGYSTIHAKVIAAGDQNLFNDTSQPMDVVFKPVGGGGGTEYLGSLSGTVFNGQNLPIANAMVQLNSPDLTSLSNATGAFSFAWLQPGTYAMTVTAAGYIPITQSVTITAQQNMIVSLILHSTSLLTITGRVVDDNLPAPGIENATVELVGTLATAVATDADGRFTIYDVQPNTQYIIHAMHPLYNTYEAEVETQDTDLDVGDLPLTLDTTPIDQPLEEAVTILKGCYPNPFNAQTTISYTIKEPARTSLVIYNTKGQKIRTLLVEVAKSGNHDIIWNGKNDSGDLVSSGVYYYKLTSGSYTSTRKTVLLK